MILTKEQKEQYNKEGYLLVKNFIDTKHIDEFMDFVAHVIKLESNEDTSKYNNEYILNEYLIELKRKNPSSSSWIYQTLLTSYKLKKFFINIDISGITMELLNMKDENNLGTVSPAFRFDIPGDVRNVRTWHQDGNYFLENEKGEDHLVVWIPMNKSTKENGSVIMAPGTHLQGKQEATHVNSDGFSSEQYTASDEQYEGVEHVYVEADKGDIAFINMDLLHSSGVNITEDEVRYTAQIRMNSINREDYRPVFLKPEYPTYKRNIK